jgi:glycogen debranching enzyme
MMKDYVEIEGRYYILASSSIAEESSRVLKYSDTFAILDRHGDIRPLGFEDHGLFHEGTRYLSRSVFRLGGKSPILLSSSIEEDNCFYAVDLTNPDIAVGDRIIRKGTVYFRRYIFLRRGTYYERLTIHNYGLEPVEFSIQYDFDADHVDIFEVRGLKRPVRGSVIAPENDETCITLGYQGLDGIRRITEIRFFSQPDRIAGREAEFDLQILPGSDLELSYKVICNREGVRTYSSESFSAAFEKTLHDYDELRRELCSIETSNEQFNDWLNRSRADLNMLLTKKGDIYYPYAGIPWYNTVFGRDGIITAIQTLWCYPHIARGVLTLLASRQADSMSPGKDAEPGKIIHEERLGELANTGEIPFGSYYGSVDATPLFIMLAGDYYERTSDIEFIGDLWPNIENALKWIDEYGDMDGDGFVEYRPGGARGLTNMGWKDSSDSVFHRDGAIAEPPIALCEVQGYVYAAKLKASLIAGKLGKHDLSEQLRMDAERLRQKFHEAFWSDEIGTYAIALDGKKRRCEVRSSNPGQCLFTGIATDEHAKRITDQLTSPAFFNGWGIRTVSSSESRYNPMSYHNGSVWPHDNSIIASGMARYGMKQEALKILTGMFDASIFLDLHRLPELFCGFDRIRGEGPILYPVACEPQAWASGAVFLLLQACLGMSINAPGKQLLFDRPVLPRFLNQVRIFGLKIRDASVDLEISRHENDVTVNILNRTGQITLNISK